MFDLPKILLHQSGQFIPDVLNAVPPPEHIGMPVIRKDNCSDQCSACRDICPTNAISLDPLTIDLGLCVFCRECEHICASKRIIYTNYHKISANNYNDLLINENSEGKMMILADRIRKEIKNCFGSSLKLRLVSAGSCNGCEMELNACGNVNFDMGRFGIEFLASPRHCDGVVLTGPLVENSCRAFEITMEAIPKPKLLILAGACAVSGGVFRDANAVRRDLLQKYQPDLYIPGCPPHPLTIINGIIELIRKNN